MRWSLIVAFLIVAGLFFWFAGDKTEEVSKETVSLVNSAEINTLDNNNDNKNKFVVRVINSKAREYVGERIINGKIKAFERVQVRTEVGAMVKEVSKTKGDNVTQGDKLILLQQNTLPQRKEKLQSLIRLRQQEVDSAVQLKQQGYQTELRYKEAVYLLNQAREELAQVDLAFSKNTVHSPISGVIEDVMVEQDNLVSAGSLVAVVADFSKVIAEGYVSEQELKLVSRGMDTKIEVLTGGEFEGKISFISTNADKGSNTFKIEVTINAQNKLREGQSAYIHIPLKKQANIHFLPHSVLTLDSEGSIGVKVLDEADKIMFKSVEVVSDSSEGFWLKGLNGQEKIVSVGQEYVSVGDTVDYVNDNSFSAL